MANNHDWQSLVHLSGLLVSEPVLNDKFAAGPSALESWRLRHFRAEYERWIAVQGKRDDDARQQGFRRWVSFVFRIILAWPDDRLRNTMTMPPDLTLDLTEYMQKLAPDLALVDEQGQPQLLIYHAAGDLDRPEQQTGRWKASPETKLETLLRRTGVPLGLLVNGDDWRLVYAEGNFPTATIEWPAQGWYDERPTLDAFAMLLGADRFDSRQPQTSLIALIRESQDRQMDVADQLGEQVRAALWVLIDDLDELDRAANGDLLREMSLADIYEMAIKVMMRLLFLLYAEEHRLLPHGEIFYDQGYGLTYLWARLQRQYHDAYESLFLVRDAWPQLLATFRLVHDGAAHSDFNLLAYGGGLFDPRAYPMLEKFGLYNITVYRILHHLLLAEGKVGGERVVQRVSYRSLDVEQFGYMYEGLLDHVVRRASEPMLALHGAKHKQPEIPLRELETRSGEDRISFLIDQTGRSRSALEHALTDPPDPALLDEIWIAASGDQALFERIRPFANLLFSRIDTRMAVIPPGRLYVTEGQTRRATGTHYTPVTLTGPIVEHTLEPLVYSGPAEGLPREQWTLRSPRDLLDLKICDMAMGSGAFLVQACRYLSRLVVDAWTRAESSSGGRITPAGDPARPTDLILVPPDQGEREILARRLIAGRCLYGVDKNPLAVEMAKLSLWLITLDKHRPFTFLDHALKAGDPLVGVSLKQLEHWSLDTSGAPQLFTEGLRHDITKVIRLRREIAAHPVNTIDDQQANSDLYVKAKAITNDLLTTADLLVGSYFNDLNRADQAALRETLLYAVQRGEDVPDVARRAADLGTLRPLHWELEFPEVFLDGRGGFDAFIGNPPFLGGSRISTVNGSAYYDLIKAIYPSSHGQADLAAFFFLRAFDRLGNGGTLGLIATNTIAQGDTRETGLDFIATRQNGRIYHAINSMHWPGSAAVVVNVVHIFRGNYRGLLILDGRPAERITPLLDNMPMLGNPYLLAANQGKSFSGSKVYGTGFVLTPDTAQALINADGSTTDVLFPFLNGEDLNSRPDQSPSRWVINFFDWPIERAEQYPDCLTILREKVKPEREHYKHGGSAREKWWQYERIRPELYQTIQPLKRVIVIALTSNTLAFVFMPKGIVYSHATVVLAYEKSDAFCLLQSSVHTEWVRQQGSSMKGDARYTPTDCFETFPFSNETARLEKWGEDYHEYRRQIMLSRQEGLTATYNRFHNPAESASDISDLRRLHVEMDHAVAAAYGWSDLDLGHGFHETRQGLRYTISEARTLKIFMQSQIEARNNLIQRVK